MGRKGWTKILFHGQAWSMVGLFYITIFAICKNLFSCKVKMYVDYDFDLMLMLC